MIFETNFPDFQPLLMTLLAFFSILLNFIDDL